MLLSPKERVDGRQGHARAGAIGGLWWPDWKNPLIWLIGFTFGSNDSPFFAATPSWATITEFRACRISRIRLELAERRADSRADPAASDGRAPAAARLAVPRVRARHAGGISRTDFLSTPLSIIISTAAIGIGTAVTMTATLAMPALLVPAGDVPRTAAGMFTVAYTCAIIIPTICGALWDVTGKPWTTFIPLCLCSVTLTVFGAIVVRYRPPAEIPLDQAA